MGPCMSKTNSAAAKENARINAMLAAESMLNPVKMLLLGTGESGKSTVFKQLQLIHGKKYDDEDRAENIELVHKNVMENFVVLLTQFDAAPGEKITGLTEETLAEIHDFLSKYDKSTKLNASIAKEIKELWSNPAVQQMWHIRADFQIMDALGYYLEEIDRVGSEDFEPNQLDILSARVRSSGILEHKFVVKGQEFSVLDVGGQRNERKKWIHCFDGVTGIVFVVAINEYDQVLFEDKTTSRVSEALTVFSALLKNSLFQNTPIILLLNKNDIFEKKIVSKPFKSIEGVGQTFDGPYAGDPGVSDAEAIKAAKQWMLDLFLDCNDNPDRQIYPYYITALDKKSVSQFFTGTKELLANAANNM